MFRAPPPLSAGIQTCMLLYPRPRCLRCSQNCEKTSAAGELHADKNKVYLVHRHICKVWRTRSTLCKSVPGDQVIIYNFALRTLLMASRCLAKVFNTWKITAKLFLDGCPWARFWFFLMGPSNWSEKNYFWRRFWATST